MKVIKKISKKGITIGCSTLLIVALLTACSNKSAGTGVNTEPEDKVVSTESGDKVVDVEAKESSTTVFGKVTTIDGNSITLALGEVPEKYNKEKQARDPANKQGDEVPADRPEGEAPENMPEESVSPNKAKGMDSGNTSIFTENGEELTIIIEDESLIHVLSIIDKSEQGSLEDIAIGSILSIEYDSNENISYITVQP